MRSFLCLGVGLLLAGCAGARVAATPVRDTTAVAASCAAVSPAEQFAAARLVFVGVMLPGPTAEAGVLGSPARMRVERYLKGHGPRVVRVVTALRIEPGGVAGGSEGIFPKAGERWKIYTNSRRQPFATSVCSGSTRVVASPALALWRAFPVQAKPRPIVPLGEGIVLDPRTGFRTDGQEFAYLEGRYALHTALPRGSDTAYRRLRAHHNGQHVKAPPLVITRVRPGTATFVTDRERMRLPVWRFFFQGVADPASVLALVPPSVFIPPALHRFGEPGPGNSIEDSATVSVSGRMITLRFVGGPAGSEPCDDRYRASAVADRRAVAFTITTIPVRVPAGEACSDVGYARTAVLRLARPLGARVLISATDGGAVPVTPAR